MPWWSWLLIWALLGGALGATVLSVGFAVVRKALGTLDALGELGDQLAAVDPGTAPARPTVPAAMFQDRQSLADAVHRRRGQLLHAHQLRRDRRVARGKLM